MKLSSNGAVETTTAARSTLTGLVGQVAELDLLIFQRQSAKPAA